MDFYVGITDKDWFENLSKLKPDEVNFWSPGTARRNLEVGTPFLFKLKSPHKRIVGGGYFLKWTKLPLSLAWEAFSEKNGMSSQQEFEEKISKLRKKGSSSVKYDEIGCTILTNPFFFKEEASVPPPRNWSSSIVQGKAYSTKDLDGGLLWAQTRELIPKAEEVEAKKHLVKIRLGQGGFRATILDNYKRRCAISGEKTLPVLESAHIKPYSRSKSFEANEANNGILLKSDLHLLFDKGLLTISPDYQVKVSSRIRELWKNGKEYYKFDNTDLTTIPEIEKDRPNRELLDWHNEEVFEKEIFVG